MDIAEPEVIELHTESSWRSLYSAVRVKLLILTGMSLGILVAFFIARSDWVIALSLLGIFPFVAVLSASAFSGVLLWFLVMPFISVLPNASLIYWIIYRFIPPILLLLVIFSRNVKARDYPPARMGPPELAMIILAFIVPGYILLVGTNLSVTLIRYADRILIPFCLYLVIRISAPREKQLVQLQWVALFIALSQSLVGFLSWYAPHLLPDAWQYLQGERTTGSLKDPDLYAAMLTFSGVILIHAAVNQKSKLIRLGFFLASGLCAIFAFLSLERAAWLGGVFVVIGLFLLYPKTMLRLTAVGVIAVAILGTGALSLHFALSVDRFRETSPVYDRLVIFDAMVQMVEEKPVLGWGYETLDTNIAQYYRRVGDAQLPRRVVTSHNTYMTVLTELGLVGFMLYMFPVLWWLVLSIVVWKRIPREGLWSRPLLGIFWLALLFQFIVSNFFDMRWFEIGLALWWLTLGFIANMVYPYLKNRVPSLPAVEHANG